MGSRSVHVVRCRNPFAPSAYIDMKVIDAIAYQFKNGKEILLYVSARSDTKKPYIFMGLGDDSEYLYQGAPYICMTSGDPYNCSRSSHVEAFVGSGPYAGTNPQTVNYEILDAVIFQTTNGKEVLYYMPSKNKSPTSRATKLVKVVNTDKNPEIDIQVEGAPYEYLTLEKVQAIAFQGPNGVESLLYNPSYDTAAQGETISDMVEIDTTTYAKDNLGNNIPPDNQDDDTYVYWPPDTVDPWTQDTPIHTGLLWWPCNASQARRPWYWWTPAQQPMDVSVCSGWVTVNGTPLAKWPPGVTINNGDTIASFPPHFVVAPFWGGSGTDDHCGGYTFPGVPMIPILGFDTLEDCIDFGLPDGTSHAGLTPPTGSWPDLANYGILPVTAPRSLDGGVNSVPNIWELLGLNQPQLLNPDLPWHDPDFEDYIGPPPTYNPYNPSGANAEAAVNQFVAYWNQCSKAENDALMRLDGYSSPDIGPMPDLLNGGVPFDWPFKVPWYGNGPDNRYSFVAGITEGIGIFPLTVLEHGTSGYIACGQLDPQVWDTSVYPPIRFATGTW